MTTGNTGGASGNAFDAVTATVPNFGSTSLRLGGLSADIQAAGNVAWTTSITGTPLTLWGRFYLLITVTPTIGARIPQFFSPTSAGASSGFVLVSTAAKIQTNAKGGTNILSTTILTTNTWYRLEFKHTLVVSGTCTTDCTIYLGDSTTATETMTQATGTGVSTDTSINKVQWGSTAATPADTVFFDDVQVNATGFPGPSPAPLKFPGPHLQAVNRSASY